MASRKDLHSDITVHSPPVAGMKLEDLRKLYFEMKEKVFKPQSTLLTTACDTEALEDLIKKYIGTNPETGEERKMNDVRKPK